MTLGLSKPPHPNQAEDRRFYERRDFTRATEIILPGGPPHLVATSSSDADAPT
jgi:hypothetical protein